MNEDDAKVLEKVRIMKRKQICHAKSRMDVKCPCIDTSQLCQNSGAVRSVRLTLVIYRARKCVNDKYAHIKPLNNFNLNINSRHLFTYHMNFTVFAYISLYQHSKLIQSFQIA